MAKNWLLMTHGDPLETVRAFLLGLWQSTLLEGMLVPRFQAETGGIVPHLVREPAELHLTDPFSPLVAGNAARRVAQLSREKPSARFVAVLRPCETLALDRLARRGQVILDEWLVVGVDCLASFPTEDFQWRLERAGGSEALTYQMLQFARQGGISPYRFRDACQMCDHPTCQSADLQVGLVGLPVKEYVLVMAKDESTARQLDLPHITDGQAPAELVAQRERALARLCQRRMRSYNRQVASLPAALPASLDQLLDLWSECSPCQACLQACPVYAGELDSLASAGPVYKEAVLRWLEDCFTCGLCDEACPKQIPLSTLIARLALQPVAA
jgi:NAD-dependent dihydropyrimidine dehydrogenase PreA subunit